MKRAIHAERILLALVFGMIFGISHAATTGNQPDPDLPKEIRQVALQRGKAIAGETFSLLSSNLMAVLKSGGVSNALPFCSVAALPLTTSIAKKHGVEVKRVSHRARNPSNKADDRELKWIQDFEAALSVSTNMPAPQVVQWVPGKVSFVAPIVIQNEVCLKCHGVAGKELTADHLALIKKHYPKDQATGFQMGQLRGVWRIDFALDSLRTGESGAATQ